MAALPHTASVYLVSGRGMCECFLWQGVCAIWVNSRVSRTTVLDLVC